MVREVHADRHGVAADQFGQVPVGGPGPGGSAAQAFLSSDQSRPSGSSPPSATARARSGSPGRLAVRRAQDLRLAPRRGVSDLPVHLQGAGVEDVLLTLERVVGKFGVLGGQGKVTQGVDEQIGSPSGPASSVTSSARSLSHSSVGVCGSTCSMVSLAALKWTGSGDS